MKRVTKVALLILWIAGGSISAFAAASVVTYEYDSYGNCTSITTGTKDGPVLEKTTYTYDDYRRPTQMIEGAQDPTSQRRWDWVYDRWFGSQGYDQSAHTSKQWRLQMEPGYDGGGNRNVTARWFDYQDQIVDEYKGVIQGPSGMYNGPDLEGVHYTYDENGQKKSYTDQLGRVTDYTYDLRNRLKDTIEPKRADQAVRPTTTTEYDLTGNKTKVTFPDLRTQRWEVYDAFGQAGTFIDERNNTTTLVYESGPMKKLRSVTTQRDKDGGGTEEQITTFYNDGLGRLWKTLFPDGSYEQSGFKFGQLDTWKTRSGQIKTMYYDARGRETSHTWTGPAAALGVSRSWDDANRVRTLCNDFSTIDYDYDGAGLVKAEGNFIAGSSGRTQTIYHRYPNGGISEIIYPYQYSQRAVARSYNSRGQLEYTGVSNANGGWFAQFAHYAYLPDGKLDHQDYANNVTTSYGYDARGFVNSIAHRRWGSDTLSSRDYYRDDRDRIIAVKKGNNPTVNPREDGHGDRFRYDEEGQLLEAWYNATDPVTSTAGYSRWDSFNYDALGNRRNWELLASKGWLNFTRKDNGLNQYRMWSPFSVINYDDDIAGWGSPGHANGVVMQDGNITAAYNSLNQPTMVYSAETAPDWMFFGYDPLGRCVKRWTGPLVNGGVPPVWSNPATYYYYDGWNLIQEGPATGGIIWDGSNLVSGAIGGTARVYVHGARVDEIVVSWNMYTLETFYHQYDALNNCSMLTDAGAAIVEQYSYDAFGWPYAYDGAGGYQGNSSPSGNRFLFQGREWLSKLKLYDYRNRMYQPELGRFMQPDPKQFAAGDYNLYRYCHNDPVNKSDPTGLVVSPLTSWGGGDWIRGFLNITNWERHIIPPRTQTSVPASVRREEMGHYVVPYAGRNGRTIYEAHTNWELQLLDKHQQPLGGVFQVDERISHTDGINFNGKNELTSGFPTRPNGSVDDPWSLPFTAADGSVRTVQTIIVEGRKATWDATTNARGEVVSAQQWAPFR